jgi:hypothetical protein
MKVLNALMWQMVVILILIYMGFTTAATLVTGFCIGFWFCIMQIALIMGEQAK